nr:hypothetical protein [Cryobacterium ruanii]
MSAPPRLRGPQFSTLTWIMLGVSLVLLLVAASTGGFSALFMTASAIGALTAIYVLVTGRRSWAVIPTRKVAAVALVGAIIVGIVGSSLVPAFVETDLASTSSQPTATAIPSATPSPTSTPLAITEEAPADPATTATAAEAASIVLADTAATDTTAIALLATLATDGTVTGTATESAARASRNCETRLVGPMAQ